MLAHGVGPSIVGGQRKTSIAELRQHQGEVARGAIEVLPPVPSDLLIAHYKTAIAVFSAEHPPVRCPLHNVDMQIARSKINMRGGSLMRNSLHVVSAECGYNRTHRACMHAHIWSNIAQCMYIRRFADSAEYVGGCAPSAPTPTSNDDSFVERQALGEPTILWHL